MSSRTKDALIDFLLFTVLVTAPFLAVFACVERFSRAVEHVGDELGTQVLRVYEAQREDMKEQLQRLQRMPKSED